MYLYDHHIYLNNFLMDHWWEDHVAADKSKCYQHKSTQKSGNHTFGHFKKQIKIIIPNYFLTNKHEIIFLMKSFGVFYFI